MSAAPSYWVCPECLSHVPNDETACGECDTEIPERWP